MEKRRLVKVVKIRLADALVGDVVNRDASSDEGWFQVAALDTLFNGSLQVSDETTYITITGGDFDTIALQVVTEVDLPTQRRPQTDAEEPHPQFEEPQAQAEESEPAAQAPKPKAEEPESYVPLTAH